MENEVFQEGALSDLQYFVDKLRKSYLGLNFYLDKIFNEGLVSPNALKLLFRFFPTEQALVYENIEKKHADIDLLAKIVNNLENIDSYLSLEMLKIIFNYSNNIIKAKVLKTMQNFSIYDEEFLLSILKKGETFLQKEALVILARSQRSGARALKLFLSIPSAWGIRNRILIQRLGIIEDVELREARDYLERFSRRHFFWNRLIRKKAAEVLKKWNVR